jgi:O-antigen/teichoic acid export membrane protein
MSEANASEEAEAAVGLAPPNPVFVAAPSGYSLRQIFRSAFLYSTSDIVLRLIGLILVPIFTRALSASDYGVIAFCGAVGQGMSPFVGLGLIGTLPILYYAYHGEELKRLISSVVNFALLVGLGVTVIALIAGSVVFGRVHTGVPFQPFVVLAIVAVLPASMYYLPLGVFNMQERPGAYTAFSVGISLTTVVFEIVLVVALRRGAVGALTAALIGAVAGMGIAAWSLRHYYRPIIDWDKVRAVLLLALPALPHLLGGTIWQVSDRFFLAGITTLATTGSYALAVTVSSVVLMVIGGITTALNPIFYRRANALDDTLPDDWARLCSLVIFIGVWVALGIAVLSREIVTMLAPPAYASAAPLICILVVGQVLTGLYWLFSPGVGYAKRMWSYPAASLPTMCLSLAANAFLVPRYGAAGAAWTLVLSGALQTLIFGYFALRAYPFRFHYRHAAMVVLGASAVYAISTVLNDMTMLAGIALKLVLLASFPLVLVVTGFFSKSEVGAAVRLVREASRTTRVRFFSRKP